MGYVNMLIYLGSGSLYFKKLDIPCVGVKPVGIPNVEEE